MTDLQSSVDTLGSGDTIAKSHTLWVQTILASGVFPGARTMDGHALVVTHGNHRVTNNSSYLFLNEPDQDFPQRGTLVDPESFLAALFLCDGGDARIRRHHRHESAELLVHPHKRLRLALEARVSLWRREYFQQVHPLESSLWGVR